MNISRDAREESWIHGISQPRIRSQGNSSVGTTSIGLGLGCFWKSSWKGLIVNFLTGCFSNCGSWPKCQEITLVSQDQIFFFFLMKIEWNQIENSRVYYWLTAYNIIFLRAGIPKIFKTLRYPLTWERLLYAYNSKFTSHCWRWSSILLGMEMWYNFPALKETTLIFLLCLFLREIQAILYVVQAPKSGNWNTWSAFNFHLIPF